MNEKTIQQRAVDAKAWALEKYPKALEVIPSLAYGDLYLDIKLEDEWVREIYYPEDD